MQKFCHHCGKQLVVGAKFCPECGTSLASLNNKPPVPEQTKGKSTFVPFAVAGEDEEGDSYLDKMEHANIQQTELHVEIVRDRPLGESVGTLISQAIAAGKPPELEPARLPTQPTDNKVFLAEFQKEAGTLRRTDEKS